MPAAASWKRAPTTRARTRRPRSRSSTTCCPGCRSRSTSSKPTTARNSSPRSTGTPSTRACSTSASGPAPRLNGKVERSHRIDAEEFYRLLEGVVIDGTTSFDDKLREWEDYYNYHRPHGGLGGQTPYERLLQKTTKPTAQA
ncbi:integrase core domain-containing protein [Pseudonocardia ailaonensis]|uniref:integrase core domain-containing protein n=1 Tax=Pseudonocardia ailaonensis TaxID=367279 RepID=UPI0031DF9243